MLNLGTSELVEDVPPTPDRLSAKIAALETAISRIPENWEPDEPGKSDYSGSEDPAMAWEDDVEFDATGALVSDTLKEPDYDAPQDGSVGWSDTTASSAEPEERIVDSPFAARVTAADAAVEDTTDEPTTAAQHDDAAPFGADEYLDEEMLRDLVSEIVRSELQGALGERITRNVRKLVRREIHRALTSQDLE